MEHKPENRLIIASNRLPIVLSREDDAWKVEPGSGGLISALAPVLRDRGGIWIGWPGTTEEEDVDVGPLLEHATRDYGYDLVPVQLTAVERDKFYLGFANEIIWPLFHDLQTRCNFDPSYWVTYQGVNRKFAEVIKDSMRSSDYVWVHDYHLMSIAQDLRALGVESSVGFFLHIPFPPLDIFLKLPWRAQVLRALLEYDLLGFQTLRDRTNFVQCVRTLLPGATVRGKGQVVTAHVDGREVRLGHFPISVDYAEFARQAGSPETAEAMAHIRERLADDTLILGVDRLDYTKGIPERLRAFELALERHPELRGKLVLTQIVVPSRSDIREYAELRHEVERIVSEVNGRFTEPGWVPIHYMYRSVEQPELLAYYRTADIALITPLKDGMNLVCKEYCVCSLEDGVLILSEFAGAAPELQREALLVNPYDVEGTAEAIVRAVTMERPERQRRMRSLRRTIREHDIFWWVDSFLKAGISQDLASFPVLEDYVPKM